MVLKITEGSSESDDDFFGHRVPAATLQELNSPDSITEAILTQINAQSPIKPDIKRHSSPYYYADLYKTKNEHPKSLKSNTDYQQQLTQETAESKLNCCNQKSKARTVGNSEKLIRAKSHKRFKNKKKTNSKSTEFKHATIRTQLPPNRLISTCTCLTSDDGLDDEMTRQKHVYETAFDCRISKSDDDLDQIDKVSNHPVLLQLNNSRDGPSIDSNITTQSRRKVTLLCPQPCQADNNSIEMVSQQIQVSVQTLEQIFLRFL